LTIINKLGLNFGASQATLISAIALIRLMVKGDP
jgi:hypothetical protein